MEYESYTPNVSYSDVSLFVDDEPLPEAGYEPIEGDRGEISSSSSLLNDGKDKEGHKEVSNNTTSTITNSIIGLSGRAYSFEAELKSLFPDMSVCDWSSVVQWWLQLEGGGDFARDERARIMERIMALFVATAQPFAKQLIEESFLEEEQRLIKPDLKFGGVAGGAKYRHGSQLFKFAQDVLLPTGRWLYGGETPNDSAAGKSASHELKSVQAIIDERIVELCFPLIVIFCYRGKRVSCASILPIQGRASLVQGMSSVHDQVMRVPDSTVEAVMARLGAQLFLAKGHHGCYGPFDLEVHRVARGSKLFVIDTARLMPPEAPRPGDPASVVFYNLLRPELLQLFGVPLSPDAFLVKDRQPRQDIRDATAFLDQQIATLALELSSESALFASLQQTGRKGVKTLLHSRGINMRHLRTLCSLVGPHVGETLQKLCVKQDDPSVVRVKHLEPPRLISEDEIRRVLAMQEKLLAGAERYQMVPTLLQLSALWTGEPFEKRLLEPEHKQWYRPWGASPLARAFELCTQCDPLFRVDGLYSIESCSALTLTVILEICLRDPGKTLAFPHWYDLHHLRAMHIGEPVAARVREFLEGLYTRVDPLEAWIDFAAKDAQWGLMREYAQLYGVERKVALKMAEYGYTQALWDLWGQEEDLGDVLLAAAQGGQLELVRELVNTKDLSANHRRSEDGVNPLYLACAYSHLEVAKFLLNAHADINSTRNDGRSPLWIACVDGLVPLIEFLLKCSPAPDVNARRRDGMTPLWIAAQEGHIEVVRLLVQAGADFNLKATDNGRHGNDGIAPIQIAREKARMAVVRYLESLHC